MAGFGLPSAVTTTGGLNRATSPRPSVRRVLDECVTRLAHQGPMVAAGCASRAWARPSVIWCIQSASTDTGRALGVGKAPMIPALQAASTSSGPEIKNIGAATTGRRRANGKGRFAKVMASPGGIGWTGPVSAAAVRGLAPARWGFDGRHHRARPTGLRGSNPPALGTGAVV